MEMDIDPPEVSYTHERGAGPNTHTHENATPRYISPEHTHTLQSPTFNPLPQIHAPTPLRRRIGGGLAIQTQANGYGTPSPTPSPSPRSPSSGDHNWRASADALQADIAAQFEAEDQLAGPGGGGRLKRKRERGREWERKKDGEEGNGGDGGEGGESEGEGRGEGDGEVDRLLDNLVWWLAETRKRRKVEERWG